ncbi:MAG: DEAD/DEAH box helicase [Planctomycetes bacterium]|nr:DEAD/DEAH box helicase [Planctomycetota bacterium]
MTSATQGAAQGFIELGLSDTILKGIDFAGFDKPRPIQVQTIPAAVEGRDVLGLAQTGTGKTAAFALPILERLREHRKMHPRALIIAPTRELATQIAEQTRALARHTGLKVITIFGGVSQRMQTSALRRHPDVIVGCPGRLYDLYEQGFLHLDQVETLVLDEADHMFDMGFLPTIRRILKQLPNNRQNLLFSATMPLDIRGLASEILHDPHQVELTIRQPAQTIDHALIAVSEDRKRDLLDRVLRREDCHSAIVFCRTKHRARRLADQLWKNGHKAIALQGNMSQNARDRAMRGFREGKFRVLVATDIVARGIDVQGVSYVLNFDVPMTSEAYTHRIGRTGRSELAGKALTFLTQADKRWLKATQKMLGREIRRHKEKGFDSGYNERNAPQERVSGAFGKKAQGKQGPPKKRRGPEPGRKRDSRRGGARGSVRGSAHDPANSASKKGGGARRDGRR